DLLWHTVTANRLRQQSLGGLLVPFLGEEKVDRLTRFIDGAIEIAPLALAFDVRLVHPPTDPHRALTPVKRLFQQRAILDGPPVDGGVIDVNPPFCHEFLDVAVLSGYATYQRTPMRMTSLGKWAPLKLIAIVALPHASPLLMEGDHTANHLK